MAQSMQSKIMAAIEQVALKAGREVASSASFANKGTLYLQRGFRSDLEVRYSFDAVSFTIALVGPAVKASSIETAEPVNGLRAWTVSKDRDGRPFEARFSSVRYHEGEVIEQLLAMVADLLTEGATA